MDFLLKGTGGPQSARFGVDRLKERLKGKKEEKGDERRNLLVRGSVI